jgi:hypothetical protein
MSGGLSLSDSSPLKRQPKKMTIINTTTTKKIVWPVDELCSLASRRATMLLLVDSTLSLLAWSSTARVSCDTSAPSPCSGTSLVFEPHVLRLRLNNCNGAWLCGSLSKWAALLVVRPRALSLYRTGCDSRDALGVPRVHLPTASHIIVRTHKMRVRLRIYVQRMRTTVRDGIQP